jgi:hypothetical protein
VPSDPLEVGVGEGFGRPGGSLLAHDEFLHYPPPVRNPAHTSRRAGV